MALNIFSVLNIESKERGVVSLLLTQSIFLGIFAGALDVGANALFLEAYSANLMPRAFMVSGAVGIVFTSVYTFLQKRLPFKLFTILNLVVAILFTGALRIGYSLSDDPRLAFALLVMMGPVIIISMLGFWGTAGRYFTLREGKRLFGIIDTGSIVGMILAFYAVPVLVRFNFKVYDTLLIGLVSLIVALLFQVIVLQRHKIRTIASSVSGKGEKRTGFLNIFRKRYTLLMALFVVLSVITAFFVHYSFMWATEAKYPDSRDLTGFLGAFFGTMMIFTVIIKSTLYGWLMKNYGLKVTLLISPALLLILTIVASVVGGFFGYGPESASFTFFFLLIALSKLFNKSLKDAIESPSMKILYQSLDSSERFDVQARIDGMVNEITAFSAGLIMAGLLLLSFISVIYFSYILIVVLILWIVLGFSIYKSYRKTLNDSLSSAKEVVVSSVEIAGQELPDFSSIPMYSDIIRLNPYFYHLFSDDDMGRALANSDLRRQLFLWKHISETLYYCKEDIADKIIGRSEDKGLIQVIDSYKKRLFFPGKKIDEAFRSSDKNIVLAALIQTVNENDARQVPHIISLLRDKDIQLRAAAIEAAGKLKVKELGSYLVDYLGHSQLYAITWSALVQMGELILENLENAFYKTGVETVVQLRIIRAMVVIGGEKANDYLFQKIGFHQRDIREAVIKGLYQNGFRSTERSNSVLQTEIYQVALAGAVNIAAESVIRDNNPENGLYEVVVEERVKTDKLLFTLLGITYDRSAIEHVQHSIEDNENEDAGFALELLNLIVDEQVFAYLEPYFDDISTGEKIKRLQNEMPVEILPYEKLLLELLNRDYLYSGNYLRICVIDAIRKIDGLDAGKYLAAQAFHPIPVVSKSAVTVLAEKDEVLHQDIAKRIESLSAERSNQDFYSDVLHGNEIINIVENFKKWKSFAVLDREIIFRLVSHLVKPEGIDIGSEENVSVLKSDFITEKILNNGLLINLSDYPTILEQMKYLASQPDFVLYQINKEVLRELLFDFPEVLVVVNKLFSDPDAQSVIKLKVKID